MIHGNNTSVSHRFTHDTTRYDTIEEFNVDSKAEYTVKERRPVGLPATGNERHGVQGSTPVSEGCDRYHPLLLP